MPNGSSRFAKLDKWRDSEGTAPSFASIPYVHDTVVYFEEQVYKQKSYLHEKYVVDGLSLRQIAVQNFTSRQSITKHLKLNGIEIRQPRTFTSRNKNPHYGEKRIKGITVEHKAELNVADVIRDLKGQGVSFREIAKHMTKLGISTKKKGQGWHPMMVKRIHDYYKY